eukprot:1201853-Pleurochrysis_carterae.AAC.3
MTTPWSGLLCCFVLYMVSLHPSRVFLGVLHRLRLDGRSAGNVNELALSISLPVPALFDDFTVKMYGRTHRTQQVNTPSSLAGVCVD